jgi:hypothetical protein
MKTEAETIAHLIQVADQVLLAKADKPLGDHEKSILKHILAGELLKTARAGQYRHRDVFSGLGADWH